MYTTRSRPPPPPPSRFSPLVRTLLLPPPRAPPRSTPPLLLLVCRKNGDRLLVGVGGVGDDRGFPVPANVSSSVPVLA